MPGCVLRVASKSTDVEQLVNASRLRPIVIFRKGQPKYGNVRRRVSGFNVEVSDADGMLEEL